MKLFRRLLNVAILLLAAIIFGNVIFAFAASNTVPQSGASDSQHAVNPNQLAPPACAGINLTNIVDTPSSRYTWFGQPVYVFNGTAANDLIIGTSGYDDLFGAGGNDCLVGGTGIDYFYGNAGTDVCIGQGFDDVYNSCESQQINRSRALPEEETIYRRPPTKKQK